MLTALFVAARIIANPLSNVFQKQLTRRSANPLFIIAATYLLLSLVCLPALLAMATPRPGAGFWLDILASALLAVAGNALLVFALRFADLSILGPINSCKAVIGLALAAVLVGEMPTAAGLCGVLLIVAGGYFVLDRSNGAVSGRGIRLRFAALVRRPPRRCF